MTTTEYRPTISTLPADPRKQVQMIILDTTEDMEPYAAEVYQTLLNTLLMREPHQAIGLTVYQGDYLECYHEDYLNLKVIDTLPDLKKTGGASRAITHVLQSLLRRNDKSEQSMNVKITYIGSGCNVAEDDQVKRRRDQAIKSALWLNWGFDLIAFGHSPAVCRRAIGFDATNRPLAFREAAIHYDV